jgi:hypothetical protein
VGTGLRYQPASEQALRPVPQKKNFFYFFWVKISPAAEQALRPVPQKNVFFDLFLVGGIIAR